jgi:hypothetical protein
MKTVYAFGIAMLSITLVIAGCKNETPSKSTSAKSTPGDASTPKSVAVTQPADGEVSGDLAKLSPEDQKLAKAQRLCPISDEPLGSMGVPTKLMIQGQPVFLCCDGCKKEALANPEKTLMNADLAKLSPEDRELAKAQRVCPITDEPLGSMGVPPKLTIQGQPVFLCCDGCEKDALANADKTVAKVKDLKEKK